MSSPLPSLGELAAALGAEVAGDANLRPERLAEPATAGVNDLALAMSPRFASTLVGGKARMAVLSAGTDWRALGLAGAVLVGRPRLAMAHLTEAFARNALGPPVIDASAVIDSTARIGDGARIGPHVSIGRDCVIGEGALIHPGVRILAGVTIGARVIIHPGAVIGSDGFSFVTEDVSAMERARASLGSDEAASATQPWLRIHSLGGVVIGDDVEIGANTCIDRGTIRATSIGDGTKIDNLVQIGHNVRIGKHCLLCGQVGVAGSSVLGDHVVLGGQAGVVDNLKIGARVVVAAGSLVLSNVPEGRAVMGNPAHDMARAVESYKALRRLPRLAATIAALQKVVFKSGADS